MSDMTDTEEARTRSCPPFTQEASSENDTADDDVDILPPAAIIAFGFAPLLLDRVVFSPNGLFRWTGCTTELPKAPPPTEVRLGEPLFSLDRLPFGVLSRRELALDAASSFFASLPPPLIFFTFAR